MKYNYGDIVFLTGDSEPWTVKEYDVYYAYDPNQKHGGGKRVISYRITYGQTSRWVKHEELEERLNNDIQKR